MRSRLIIVSILFFTDAFGQSKVRFPFWTFNTKDTNVFGIAAGYTTTRRIENVQTNGLRFELLGIGIFLPLIPDVPISKNDSMHIEFKKQSYAEKINGINLSPIGAGCNCKVNGLNIYGPGSITKQVNGISAGLFMNVTEVQNGLQASAYFNWTYKLTGVQFAFIRNTNFGTFKGIQISAMNETTELRGIQIGLYNKTKNIKGIQIGIWNDNGKRKRPLLNF
jgi:hypothetical protein